VHVCVCVCVSFCVYVLACVHVFVCVSLCVNVLACVRACVRACMYWNPSTSTIGTLGHKVSRAYGLLEKLRALQLRTCDLSPKT
jgi:hypothetical protein